jgi:hypothetical protein
VSSTDREATPSIFVEPDGLVELDTAASPPDIVELDTVVPASKVDETLSDSILPSLAQPLTTSPYTIIKNALFNRFIIVPPHKYTNCPAV